MIPTGKATLNGREGTSQSEPIYLDPIRGARMRLPIGF
jgi:hypothetical protein